MEEPETATDPRVPAEPVGPPPPEVVAAWKSLKESSSPSEAEQKLRRDLRKEGAKAVMKQREEKFVHGFTARKALLIEYYRQFEAMPLQELKSTSWLVDTQKRKAEVIACLAGR